jgi:DNA-binding SARP family transcriptional activator/tetratricopeptide (TPR) repeat protein
MEFRMLGPFEGWQDGVLVDLGDLQQRHALVVLLLHANRPVSTDRMIEIIWGDKRPRTNLVPGYIAKLRRIFRDVGATDVTIETTPTGYVLRLLDEQVDTTRFRALYTAASHAPESATAARLLHEALDLWRGAYLEDLDFGRVTGTETISLDEARLDAVEDLAAFELAAGNYRWVRDRLRPLVHDDPSRQSLAILLIRALLAGGDRVRAIDVYHSVRSALDEYGMKTAPELRGLARLAQYGNPTNSLPSRPPRFTGRHRELASVESHARRAADGTGPVVVWVNGTPGIGKTALAVEAAYRLRRTFPDGQLYVQLNGFTHNVEPTSPSAALTRLLLDLGMPIEQLPATVEAKVAMYQDMLFDTRTVVVLDNAVSVEQVRQLLPAAPTCLTLVTSRMTGHIDAIMRLGPMPTADATELFGNLVGDDRLRGRHGEVVDVVGRCGRVPLQIRMVASQFSRHDSWPLDHLVRLLDETRSPRPGDDAATVASAVSYQQLAESHRTVFRLFGSIPGQDLSVSGAAALANCDVLTAHKILEDLHDASLLEEAVPERYHMLDPLKDFTTVAIPPKHPDERFAGLVRLLDFYLTSTATAIAAAFPFDRAQQPAIARSSSVPPPFGDSVSALTWLASERVNLVEAIRYASGHQLREHAWQLSVLLWRYFYTTGNLRDWAETLELAEQALKSEPVDVLGQAHVLLRLSGARWQAGELQRALALATAALPKWEALGMPTGAADTVCAMALATMDLGDDEQAIAHFTDALRRYDKAGDSRGQANALSVLGHLNEIHGALETALAQHESAVDLLRSIGHKQGLAHALDNLGSVQQQLGRLQAALRNHEEARKLASVVGDRLVAAYALNNMGNVHRQAGQLDAAIRRHDEADEMATELADPTLRAQIRLDRGTAQRICGDHHAALHDYLSALNLSADTGDRRKHAHANHGVARALHALGNHDRATTHWNAALAELTALRQPLAEAVRRERDLLECACSS